MPLDILLQFLEETQKTMDVQIEGNIIENVKIDISKFEKVVFNKVSPGAQTPIEMLRRLYHLGTVEKFNEYLVNKQDEIFFKFLHICNGNTLADGKTVDEGNLLK